MDVIGANVRLAISEPWEETRTLSGTIMRRLSSPWEPQAYYLLQSSEGGWLTISARYSGDSVQSVLHRRSVVVGVGIVLDPSVVDTGRFDADQVRYAYIGQIELVK